MSKPTTWSDQWGDRKATVVTAPVKKKEAKWGYFLAAATVVLLVGALLVFNMEASQTTP